MAKLILSKVNLLILDEPTNHLDIPSREALEHALAAFEGTLICVSHDRYFIRQLATRIIEILPPDAPCASFDFTPNALDADIYAAYREKRECIFSPDAALNAAQEQEQVSSQKKDDSYQQRKKEAAEKRKSQRQLAAWRQEIEVLEAELCAVTEELYGSAASDYMRAAELDDRKTVIEDRLLQLYELTES